MKISRLIGTVEGIEKLDFAHRIFDDQRGALGDISDLAAEEMEAAFIAGKSRRCAAIAERARNDMVFIVLEGVN